MDEATKYISLFLVSTTILNLVISIFARIKTKDSIYNVLVFYWISLFINYLAVALLSDSPEKITLSFYFQCIPTFIVSAFLMDARKIRINYKFYGLLHLVALSTSLFLVFRTDFGFTLSILPVTISISAPMFHPMWNILVTKNHESNWIEKGIAIMFATGIIHHFNYAFFRMDPAAAWWGWSVSIAQYQSLMIFLPLLVLHRNEENEKKKIQMALAQLTGVNTQFSNQIEELYKDLNKEISQKKDLTDHLSEEREMNELLIRTISHDMANPLSVIGAYADLMTSGRIQPSEFSTTMDKIRSNVESAKSMIKRIREAILSRNHAGLVAIHDVSLNESLKTLVKQFETKLSEKSLKLHYHPGPDVIVVAEETTLVQHVFSNFFLNAIKFSPPGREISITVVDNGTNVQVIFKDQGVGIPKHRLDKKLMDSTEDPQVNKGSGIGLRVAGYFLRKFKGSYEIQSEGSNLGTTIKVNLMKI
jgi:signal transduction histidine kinase